MIDLSTLELERLKLLLSELYPQKSPAASPRRILTTEEKISTLDILRSKFPDLFSDLPEEKLKDNNFLVKYLADPYKRNKIRNAVLRRLSSAQQLELSQALGEETVATEVYKQPAAGEIPTEQASPTEATTGASAGGMPAGLPSMPSAPSITFTKPPVVIHDVPHASGMEGGAGTGISATSKIDRLEAERVGPATAKGNRLTANATAKPDSLPESASRIKPVQQKPVQQVFQTPSGLNFSAFKSSFSSGFKKVQNLASAANPFIKINSSRIIRGLGGMVKGIGNGIVHTGLPGVYNAGARAGMGVLNSGGSIANLGRFGGGGSSSIFGKMGRFGKGRGGGVSSLGKVGKSRGKWALLGLLAFLGVGILGFTGANQPGTTTGGGIPTGSSDISQCKFTRGDHNPKETSFKSNLLLSYIQEAAQKANIPPVVLAAFIRVESPSTSGMSDDQITNYAANCAESPTKALGIMQIQPPGTTSARGDPASCDDCIDAGAKLVGKTVSTMTTADYCDPRTSIIVGGGWILKKMNKLGLGDGTKWDTAWTNDRKAIETLVRTYYGDILYPNSNTGPFNYADDVWTSIQNCQTSSSYAGLPPGQYCTNRPASASSKESETIPDPQLQAAIQQQFGIKMTNFSAQELRWTWEKLWDISGSNFLKLIKDYNSCGISSTNPIMINKTGDCAQISCNNITFCNIANETAFKVVLIHELGHIVYHYTGANAMKTEHLNLYKPSSGSIHAVTSYGATDVTENYPEMLTYYLNPSVSEQTSIKHTNSTIPYSKPENADYYQLANKILCGGT